MSEVYCGCSRRLIELLASSTSDHVKSSEVAAVSKQVVCRASLRHVPEFNCVPRQTGKTLAITSVPKAGRNVFPSFILSHLPFLILPGQTKDHLRHTY